MKYTGRTYKAPSGQWSWAIAEHGMDIQSGAGYDDEDSAIEAMETELATHNEAPPSTGTKNLNELILGEENQKLAHEAVAAAVTHAIDIRRQMVDRVNQNQRLEGYEPDDQLHQLQEQFIAGELTTGQMIEILTDYARKEVKEWPIPELTEKQFKITALVDTCVSELAFSGLTVDPLKIIMWKKYVIAGMEWETLLQIILNDDDKIIAIRPKQEFPDYPGLKSMGGGYYINDDD